MVVAALGHSDTHFDYCFDLMFHLFFISPWTVLGFQFNFEMILLRYCNYFGFQIGLLLHFTFNRSFSFVLQSRSILLSVLIYFFFYFLLNLWKIVKFWEAALGHHRGVRVLQNHFNWVDVVKSLRWQICITNLLSWNYRRIARPLISAAGRVFLHTWEDSRRVAERFAGGLTLLGRPSLDPLYTITPACVA